MELNWTKYLAKPIVALAPMADMTDSPFCLMAKKFGWPLVFREMVSADALVRDSEKTLAMAEFTPAERPIIQQIFGHDPKSMGRAAAMIYERFQPDGIDINMGCPVYKIVSSFNGSSLMREPERAAAIVRAVKAAVPVPVSVKTRLGWSAKTDCLDFVKVLEQAGADAITIHGRTKTQGYSGVADWTAVGAAAAGVKIPVLVNGDINTPEKVAAAVAAAGAAGCLVGRGALGCPWFFRWYEELRDFGERRTVIVGAALAENILEHARLHMAHYGERGIITFRKHLTWYFRGLAGAKKWRETMMQISNLAELKKILKTIEQV